MLDDAAFLPVINSAITHDNTNKSTQGYVVSTDTLVENIHFFSEDSPGDIARKALRVNVSDIVAKGARPDFFLLNIAMPASLDLNWFGEFARALRQDAKAYSLSLLGGDTVCDSQQLVITITVIGSSADNMVTRAGARAGDTLLVSGTIGDSALGLALRLQPDKVKQWGLVPEHEQFLLRRYLQPEVRFNGWQTIQTFASAAMDISDGFYLDLARLCRASGVTASINLTDIPLSIAAHQILNSDPDNLSTILTGGDDYELLVCVAAKSEYEFISIMSEHGIRMARLATLESGSELPEIIFPDGKKLEISNYGYQHFKNDG